MAILERKISIPRDHVSGTWAATSSHAHCSHRDMKGEPTSEKHDNSRSTVLFQGDGAIYIRDHDQE